MKSRWQADKNRKMHPNPQRSVHAYVVNELGRRIISGEWPAGRALPLSDALCDLLDVSRVALREALIALTAKGLITSKPRIGTLVRPKEDWDMLDPDILHWRVEFADQNEVMTELYQLRHLIEPNAAALAASLAADQASTSDIEQIHRAYEDMAAAGDDPAKLLDADSRFHRAIFAASRNSLFSSLGAAIASALIVEPALTEDHPPTQTGSLRHHKAVLNAIADGDANAARIAMQHLIDSSETHYREAQRKRIGHSSDATPIDRAQSPDKLDKT